MLQPEMTAIAKTAATSFVLLFTIQPFLSRGLITDFMYTSVSVVHVGMEQHNERRSSGSSSPFKDDGQNRVRTDMRLVRTLFSRLLIVPYTFAGTS